MILQLLGEVQATHTTQQSRETRYRTRSSQPWKAIILRGGPPETVVVAAFEVRRKAYSKLVTINSAAKMSSHPQNRGHPLVIAMSSRTFGNRSTRRGGDDLRQCGVVGGDYHPQRERGFNPSMIKDGAQNFRSRYVGVILHAPHPIQNTKRQSRVHAHSPRRFVQPPTWQFGKRIPRPAHLARGFLPITPDNPCS